MHVKLSQYRDVIAALQDPTLRQGLYDDGQVIMDSVLLTLHGDAHRIRRRLEQKLFTRPNIRFYETQVIPTLLKQYIDPFMTEGGGDILPLTLKTSMGLTALIAGLDVPPGDDQAILRLLDLVKTFSEGATLVHSTRPKEEVEGEVLAALANLEEEFLIPSIQRRQALLSEIRSGQGDEAALPKDVLITLMKAGAQHPLERDVLRREIAFYLQAGAHSTANSTAHALWDILRWQDRPHHPDRLEDPIFLERCVHESMRLHPASPVAIRRSKTTTFELDLKAANQDPTIFGEDASVFNPERSLPSGIPPYGLTFGAGVHSCLGKELDGGQVPQGPAAKHHIMGFVALILQRLIAGGAMMDPERPPVQDQQTSRANWAHFYLKFCKNA